MRNSAIPEKEDILGSLGARRRSAVLFVAIAVLIATFALCFTAPATAYAKSYAMPNDTINATVQPNGDLKVSEQRTFTFDGSFTAVWWTFDSLPSGASVSIDGASIAPSSDDGTLTGASTKLSSVPFQLSWRDAGGPGSAAYSFDAGKNTAYVFLDETDTTVTIQLDYTVADAVQKYADVGELYWQFVGKGWAEPTKNASLTVTLPVPAGQAVSGGDNVRAWGHGPLDATVSFNDDGTISYHVPSVDAGSFAEARVTFPSAWLSGVNDRDVNAHTSTYRLDQVLQEEQTWADQANMQRAATMGTLVFAVLISLALLIWAIIQFVRYGKELEPTFKDEYWRADPVPGEHPAVIGRICRFDAEDPRDFTATIMHLANLGALQISKGSYPQGEKRVDDYYLTRNPQVELTLNSAIDRKAMELLFDTIGEGQPSLWIASIQAFAEAHPEEFNDGMADWQGQVSLHVSTGEYFEAYSQSKRFSMGIVAVALVIVCIGLGMFFDNPLMLIPGIVVGIAIFVVSRFMERRTQKGADAYARCKALKKWLTEFSALDERPPTDVKVWGDFMVYAFIFGVAEQAMRELRQAVPEVFQSDAYYDASSSYVPWYAWYGTSAAGASPLPDFGSMLSSSVSESVQAVASALADSSSSGVGGGGGFSGGGGGGFGGGGGAR